MVSRIVERMAVEIDGEGEAVLCLHGLGGTSNTFTPQMQALSGRLVIRPDLPGAGRSDVMDAPTLPRFAEAIARMAERLSINKVSIVAHSLGTIVAQHLAAERPMLVRRMVLIGALSAMGLPQTTREAMRERAALARRQGLAGIASRIAEVSTSAESKTHNPAAVAFVRESIMRQPCEGYARTCEALAAAQPAKHEHIRCPTLIITGEQDASAPPSVARELAERIAGARVEILPRCGHWPTIERPAEVNAELRRFI